MICRLIKSLAYGFYKVGDTVSKTKTIDVKETDNYQNNEESGSLDIVILTIDTNAVATGGFWL